MAGAPALKAQAPLVTACERLGRPLRILVPDGSQANVAPVIAGFEQSHGCRSEMIVVDLDDINATLTLESIFPELGVDVALPATFGIPDLADSGAIRPLAGLGPHPDNAAYRKGELYRAGDEFDGQRWGFQTDGDVYLMFYQRDMLEDPDEQARYADQTGTPLSIPQTWEELDRQMAFFHRPDQGRFGGCLYRTATYVAWEWWTRFHAAGGLPFDAEFHPRLASAPGEAALETMIAANAHLTGTQLGLFDNWARYNAGDIYANIGWGGTQKALNMPGARLRGRVANGPLPGAMVDGKPLSLAYFNWGWSYVVARHCPEPALAYNFCKFAVGAKHSSDAVAAAAGYFDPFRKEHYSDPRIIDVYGRSFLREHRRAMAAPIPDLYVVRRSEYFDVLTFWLLRALSGAIRPEVALKNIENAWESTTEQVGRTRQAARWKALYAAYPDRLRPLWEADRG
ncbi:hypothetical protein U879_01620 [Defluviimonas sp. 20V17]|nr:hypothetical protein [Allgaiera indica]KDB05393.1 hypothetical protein U879_01620 [Defluviimonas sp. 20V17]GHE04108.1 hypothetical protein GCM10008024_29890 [Allgaiera indica]